LSKLVSIIMPALNEAIAIPGVIRNIPIDVFADMGYDVEILVVDNGSLDGTKEKALEAGARVVFEPRTGYGYAYKKGFAEAKGSIICTLDADGSYPTDVIPDYVNHLLDDDLDFISTDRLKFLKDGAMNGVNRVGNAVLSFVSRLLFRFPFRDSQSGMWVFRKSLLKKLKLCSGGMALSEEIKVRTACDLNAKVTEFPIHYANRFGTPKLRPWRDGFINLFHLLRLRLIRR